MGSRLNVILKRDGIITVSYSRIWASNLPIYLAFGPVAAWEGLSDHQRGGAALFKSTWGEKEWINNNFQSVAHMIDGGDEGSVIVDWDDNVLWYFTDFDYEKYGEDFWGNWFASWVDVFWPGWEVLRPRTSSFRDISKKLGLKTELSYTESWNYDHTIEKRNFYDSYNPLIITHNICGEIISKLRRIFDEIKYGREDYRSESKFLALISKGKLKFYRLKLYSSPDNLIYGGPKLIPTHITAHKLCFEDHVNLLEIRSFIGLVDFDKKQAFFTPGSRGADANPYAAWHGWKAKADRQGLCSWLANTDIDWPIDTRVLETEVDTYFEKILEWCAEVGPTNDAISESLKDILSAPIEETALKQNPFPRKADASGSIVISGKDDNLDIDAWLKVSKSNQVKRAGNYRQFYEQMKPIYLSDSRLKERLLIDRHHSKSDWVPDLEAYSVLNEVNPNHTIH